MKKSIGMMMIVLMAVSGVAFAADEQPASVVAAGVERRQDRRETIAPAAAEVTKGATDVAASGMERRQTRRDNRRGTVLGIGNK